MDRLFKDMFYQLANYNAASIDVTNVINELKEFLRQKKRYRHITKPILQFIIPEY